MLLDIPQQMTAFPSLINLIFIFILLDIIPISIGFSSKPESKKSLLGLHITIYYYLCQPYLYY